ncbi:MAG: hypothetical protein P1P64_09020 [Treponemataceae bacterium]
MKQFSKFIFSLVFIFFAGFVFAQDEDTATDAGSDLENFDILFSDDSTSDQSSNFKVTVGGSLNTGGTFFFNDFKTFKDTRASSLFWGNLHIEAVAPVTKAYFGLKLNDQTLPFNFKNKPKLYPVKPQIPRFIDEAYMQATIDSVTFGGGLKKITWGKADAFSVLDVINTKDLSDPTISEMKDLKLARPMLYLSAYLPKEMKLEAVYLPIFEGANFALSGRWKPKKLDAVKTMSQANIGMNPDEILNTVISKLPNPYNNPMIISLIKKQLTEVDTTAIPTPIPEIDTAKLKYSQAGLRYTATIDGYHDLGIQYYYGFLPMPAFSINPEAIKTVKTELGQTTPNMEVILDNAKKAITLDYNPYHQIGIDYALAMGPINFRTEFAGNITYDIKGTKPDVHNPSLAWNVGIDYTTPIGLSLNLCASENIKLMHKKIGTEPYDIEKDSKLTDTKIMLLLWQPLLRDSLNLKLRTIMACETVDFMMVPSVDWTFGTLLIKAECGFFFGKKDGLFSQYKDNNYLSLSINYGF